MAFVNAVLLGYRKHGADPSAALREAQIAPALLREPSACVTASQFEALCRAAMQQLDDEALGWFSRRLPWGSYGLLCRASLGSQDLEVAIKRWCRHHRLLIQDVVLTMRREGTDAVVRLEECREFDAMREFCLVTSFRYLHGYACWAVDSRIPFRSVTFPFPQPAHASVYPLIFPGGQLKFGASHAEMRIDSSYLELKIRRDEAALRQMLQRAIPLTVTAYKRDRLLQRRVRALLVDDPCACRNAEQVAANLGVSTRSLHRQLADEGTSLQALRDHIRLEKATALLTRTKRPIKQIAGSIGFSSEKSFYRAFKDWTGTTPSEVRASGNEQGT